mgnify:FL=1
MLYGVGVGCRSRPQNIQHFDNPHRHPPAEGCNGLHELVGESIEGR